MSSFDHQLQQLYMDLADEHARLGETTRAADEYALAFYYADRIGDEPLALRCRRKVARNNPNHVVCHASSAPLFFAPLLMCYSASHAREELEKLRSASAKGTAAAEELGEPTTIPPTDESPKTALSTEWEHHHPLEASISSMDSPPSPPPIADEFAFQNESYSTKHEIDESPGIVAQTINLMASLTVLFGLAAVGFFTYQLFPLFLGTKPTSSVGQGAEVTPARFDSNRSADRRTIEIDIQDDLDPPGDFEFPGQLAAPRRSGGKNDAVSSRLGLEDPVENDPRRR